MSTRCLARTGHSWSRHRPSIEKRRRRRHCSTSLPYSFTIFSINTAPRRATAWYSFPILPHSYWRLGARWPGGLRSARGRRPTSRSKSPTARAGTILSILDILPVFFRPFFRRRRIQHVSSMLRLLLAFQLTSAAGRAWTTGVVMAMNVAVFHITSPGCEPPVSNHCLSFVFAGLGSMASLKHTMLTRNSRANKRHRNGTKDNRRPWHIAHTRPRFSRPQPHLSQFTALS